MRLRLGRFDSFFGWLLSYCNYCIARVDRADGRSARLPARYSVLVAHSSPKRRAHLRRSRARFSSVFHTLFALFGTISALFIATIEQVRHLAEGLLKLAP